MKLVPEEHYRNREQFPAAEMAKYYGKEVAWSLDGLHVVASCDDPSQICAAVKNAGLSSEEVVLAYVPFPDEAILGSAWLADAEDAGEGGQAQAEVLANSSAVSNTPGGDGHVPRR